MRRRFNFLKENVLFFCNVFNRYYVLIFKKIQNYITGLWNGVEAEQLPQLGLPLQKRIENENDVVEGLPNPIYCYPLQKHATAARHDFWSGQK